MSGNIIDLNSAMTQERLEEVLKRQSVDVDDIRDRLHASARQFVEWLFSGRALIHKGEARVGDVTGTAGGSLAISLQGASAGLWKDHATDESGDLIGLYMSYMGYSSQQFPQALRELASEFLGDPIDVKRAPWHETAVRRIEKKAKELGTKPRDDMLELGPKVADWKYYDLTGTVIASVARYEPNGPESKTYRPFCYKEENGQKVWRMGAPLLRPLYRLPEIVTCQTVVLVEGEKCAKALADLGIDATTAMQGAHSPVEKTDWSPIQGKHIIIWPDNDKAGLEYSAKVAMHLKAIGCTVSIVQIPDGKPMKWDAADCVAEGGDPREVINSASRTIPPLKFQIFSWKELENLPPPAWDVDGYIPEGGFVGIYGPSGHFKSFVVVDLAACKATGREWHGAKVKQGPVLYVAAEGQRGFRKRLVAWVKSKQELEHFYVLPAAPQFPADVEAMDEAIRAMPEKPSMIILDTLARTFVGNENAPDDMGAWIRSATWLQATFSATVIFIHHSGKDTDKKDRGHTSLRGASDTMIRVQKSTETSLTIEVDKQKDDEQLLANLRTVTVEIGTDDMTGKPVTSLVLVTDEGVLPNEKTSNEKRKASIPSQGLGGNQDIVFKLLKKSGPLGFMRLLVLSKIDKGSLGRTLRSLSERGLIEKIGNSESAPWSIIQGSDDDE